MFHLILSPASRKYTAWKEYWTWWMLPVIWVVMFFNSQFRFPLVLPLHSMLLCIPLRVVRFSLLKTFSCLWYLFVEEVISNASVALLTQQNLFRFMRPLDGQYYCALRLQRLLVTAAGNELSEVDVIAFKVEAKQLQFGTQVSGFRWW